MILWLTNICFALLAIGAYYLAPEGYCHNFCIGIVFLYLMQNILWFCFNKRTNWLGFEFFFMISFFCVNFIYPIIYAPTYAHWSFFAMDFNRHVINQATAMAYLAYTFYMIGITPSPWNKREEPLVKQDDRLIHWVRMLFIIAVVSFALFVIAGGYKALAGVYSGGNDLRDVGVFSYFNNIFSISALLLATFVFRVERKKRWGYILFLIICIMVLLSTGSRQLSISIVLILMTCYSMYVYHLKGWQVACILFIGAGALFLIMVLRKAGLNVEDWNNKLSAYQYISVFDVFEDLTINAINLYVLVDWGNLHDLTWLHGMLIDLASPIPKLGTWLIDYMNEASELLHGGDLPSYILLGRDAHWGTGTNMVGEAYRSFGLIGMCIVMWGIGCIIRIAYYKSGENIYWNFFYWLMVGHAVIYPRAPLLYDPRTIVWGLIILAGVRISIGYLLQLREKYRKEATA